MTTSRSLLQIESSDLVYFRGMVFTLEQGGSDSCQQYGYKVIATDIWNVQMGISAFLHGLEDMIKLQGCLCFHIPDWELLRSKVWLKNRFNKISRPPGRQQRPKES